jgi:hypothetical protein
LRGVARRGRDSQRRRKLEVEEEEDKVGLRRVAGRLGKGHREKEKKITSIKVVVL